MSSSGQPVSSAPVTDAEHDATGPRPTLPHARLLATAAVVVAAVLHLRQALAFDAPRTPRDEVTLLLIGRLLSGQDVPPLEGQGYYPGWSFVLTPLWWLLESPESIYRGALLLGVAVSLLSIVPATALARRLGLVPAEGVLVSALALCVTSRTVLSAYALSEHLLVLALLCVCVAAWDLWERPSWRPTFGLVVSATLAYLTHPRAVVVVLVGGIWCVMLLVRRPVLALAGLGGLGVGYYAVGVVVDTVNQRILLDGFSQFDNLGAALETATPVSVAQAATGQLWALQAGTAGLAAVGAAVLTMTVLPAVRRRRIDPSSFVLGLATAGVAASIVTWSGRVWLDGGRLDVWLYERYSAPYVFVLLLVALCWLVTRGGRSPWVVALAATAVLAAGVWLGVARQTPLDGYLGRSQAAGLEPYAGLLSSAPVAGISPFWIVPTIVVLGVLLVGTLCRSRIALLGVVAAALVGASLLAQADVGRPAPETTRAALAELESQRGGRSLGVDVLDNCLRNGYLPLNWAAYWLAPRDVRLETSEAVPTYERVLLSCSRETDPPPGAFEVPLDSQVFRLWVSAQHD